MVIINNEVQKKKCSEIRCKCKSKNYLFNNPEVKLSLDNLIKEGNDLYISTELKNPHLTGLISVTKVKTTPDLRFARVYVSMINEKNRKQNLSILKQSSGFIRSGIAKKVNLRTTPELVFEFDESIEYGSKIDEILKDISKDWKKE